MKRFGLAVAISAVISVGCVKEQPVQPLGRAGPAYLISDGAHGGNAFFFFLPPLVPDSSALFHAGTFSFHLSPVAEVCTLTGDPGSGSSVDCVMSGVNPVLVFGPATMALDVTNEQYQVNWDTQSPTPLDPSKFYRITVRGARAGTMLGFLDVDPVDQGMKNLKTGEVVSFQDGRTLPIKVRIENRAFCENVGTDCAAATVGTAGGTVLADRAGVQFPPGVLPGDRVVIIEQVLLTEGERCLLNKSDLLEYPPCYRFRTDPGPTPFNPPFAIATICPDLSVFPQDTRFRQLFQDDQEAGLRDANADFLPCTLSTKTALRDGWRGLLARLIDVVRPRPVFAATAVIDEGAGGVTPGFSRFVNAVRPRIEIVAGQAQTAVSGTQLPVNPTVRVTATHFDPRLFESPPPLAGVSVAFTPSGDGVVGSQPAMTGANGMAATTWKLATAAGGNTLSASAKARGSPVMFTATGVIPATLIDCGAGVGGDLIDRGFYVASFPGTRLDRATLYLSALTAGTYTFSLTARSGTYSGTVLGTAAATVTLTANDLANVATTFTFPSPAVTQGSTVTFAIAQTAGPTGAEVFYAVPPTGNPACPVVQTNGTTPPLDTFRRQGVNVKIEGGTPVTP